MSDEKKSGLGLFINQKKNSSGSAPAAASSGAKPKDVKKRWLYVGIAAIGTVVVGSSMLAPQDAAQQKPKSVEQKTISVEPPKANERRFENQISDDMTQMKLQLEAQTKELNAMKAEKEKAALAGDAAKTGTPPVTGTIVTPPSMTNDGGLKTLGAPPVPAPPIPPTPTVSPSSQTPAFTPPSLTSPKGTAGSMPEMPPAMGMTVNADPMVFDAPSSAASATEGGAAKATGKGPSINAKTSYRKNDSAGLLPAGTFAPVVLLNGVDAGTSSATQSNPMPILMNVQDQATLPGAAKYRIKNCFVLGTGYGDLSAERVYVRFSRLSCVDKSDHLVLSQEVAGYVVDSDGKLGLRGKVMDRQGAKLGKAMLAGFAQGLAGALGQSQSSVTSNLSTGSSMSSISGSAALRASGLGGAQVATSQLAEFYLKEAQSIFPVISVDTGRTATIVFTGSAALNWSNGESQYVQEVKPTN
jgi:conjugal transfer pilus assembly protein TraB